MKRIKKPLFLLLPALCIALTGCGLSGLPQDGSSPSSDESISLSDPPSIPDDFPDGPEIPPAEGNDSSAASVHPESSVETPAQTDEPNGEKTATLYIGTRSGGFAEYSLSYQGELTPETLIQGIADLTGWNLTLAENVITGKAGMSVCLSDESSLYTDPPDPQKDEFHVFDGLQLAETILDSIQKTLQSGFTGEGGNPDALDIYFYRKGEKPLELPDLGLSWPLDQPYMWKEPAQQPQSP